MDLLIPDISEFQGIVDWPRFGSDAVIVRINYGNVKVDNYADINVDGARSRCKVRGWYTYLTAGEDPVAQADVLVRVLNAHSGLQPTEFIACDDEEGTGDQSPRVDAFLNEVDVQLKSNPNQDWWYSGLNFSIAHNLQATRGRRWIAAYGQGEPTVPHDLWQYTDAGTVAGVNGGVDMSIFHGDINQLIALIGGQAVPTITDTVVPSSPVHGRIFANAQWYDWDTLAPLQTTDQTGSTGKDVEWTEAKQMDGTFWFLRIANSDGSPGAWALKDEAVDDGGFDPTHFRPAPPPPPAPTPPPPAPVDDDSALEARITALEGRVTHVETELTNIKAAII